MIRRDKENILLFLWSLSNPSIFLIQSSIGPERSRSSLGGRRPGPGGTGGSRQEAGGSSHTPEYRGWGEENGGEESDTEGEDSRDRGRQKTRQDRSVTCRACGLLCRSTQQLSQHVVEEGRTCLQELGHDTVEQLKKDIRNMRKKARVSRIELIRTHFSC